MIEAASSSFWEIFKDKKKYISKCDQKIEYLEKKNLSLGDKAKTADLATKSSLLEEIRNNETIIKTWKEVKERQNENWNDEIRKLQECSTAYLKNKINKKDKFIDDFSDYIKNLDFYESIAFSLVLMNGVLLSSVISIAFIFFGDYLIVRFKLETKYPKNSKIIKLRITFQRYYLILNLCYILAVIWLQLYLAMVLIS